MSVKEVQNFLVNDFKLEGEEAFKYASISNGNLNKAIDCYLNESGISKFLPIFIKWMRLCYSRNIAETIDWVNEFSKMGREPIKNFLLYTLDMFRNCLMDHYKINSNGISLEESDFLQKFKPFINHNNIINLTDLINEAHFHIERNANAKILLLDVSIQLFKYLRVEAYHQK